jgi:hypothetical protein
MRSPHALPAVNTAQTIRLCSLLRAQENRRRDWVPIGGGWMAKELQATVNASLVIFTMPNANHRGNSFSPATTTFFSRSGIVGATFH